MKKLLSYILVLFSTSVALVACQPKDDGNKDQEITYARQAYDRCVQGRGQDACNVVRGSTVMSVREYFGNANAMGGLGMNNGLGYNNMGVGYNMGYNPAFAFGTQYTAQQLDNYFRVYLARGSKEDIGIMANQWANSWGSAVNGFGNQPMNSSRCSAYGCL